MKIIDGGVTSPIGFEAASAAAQIKYQGRDDMMMVYSEAPCRAAGTFTTNVVKAAPVIWDKKVTVQGTDVHAVVANAGIANACTGEEGLSYCKEEAEETAAAILAGKGQKINPEDVLVASTGVIGMQLPMDRVKKGIRLLVPALGLGREDAVKAAQAVMTTDTRKKECAVTISVKGKTVTIGGMCKGSGMIHPNMCTMLSFVMTDANISKELLQKALSDSVQESYNMISVDGDMSTNDTCLLLANGQAGNEEITEEDEDYKAFCEALHYVNTELAKKIAGDGEGATALLEVQVKGADTKEHAKTLAKSVVESDLVKTAIYGHDANWGRIYCALGYAGVDFDPDKVRLSFQSKAGEVLVAENGSGVDFDEGKAAKVLSEPEVTALIDMQAGDAEATAWGCDLTYDYVKINADYRS